jgi:hypothetical protein
LSVIPAVFKPESNFFLDAGFGRNDGFQAIMRPLKISGQFSMPAEILLPV